VFSSWFAYELNWKHERQQAREWLAAQANSWYAPSLEDAKIQAVAPWTLRLFGENGVVAIGMDVDQFKGPVPYSPEVLKQLFPEAEVDFSINGKLVFDHGRP
jgi:hypothetical protein